MYESKKRRKFWVTGHLSTPVPANPGQALVEKWLIDRKSNGKLYVCTLYMLKYSNGNTEPFFIIKISTPIVELLALMNPYKSDSSANRSLLMKEFLSL